jgi:hypothetical protein
MSFATILKRPRRSGRLHWDRYDEDLEVFGYSQGEIEQADFGVIYTLWGHL